jgi:aspartyl-tRNA(Asn)/glutamyl-tRNA(Gln) amidotransferase subunit C
MPDTIDAKLVQHVARLARITLTDAEAERFGRQLADILRYVEQLGELDVTNVQPLAHAADVTNVLRDDQPRESLPVELALREAPATDGRFFLVPQVLGEDSGA